MESREKLFWIASGAAIAIGGFTLWKWLKNIRHGGKHGHHHGHGPASFDNTNLWMSFHYPSQEIYDAVQPAFKNSLDYCVELADICKKRKTEGVLSRAMDIGCSVGRITFELAASYDEVIGVDVEDSALNTANQLRKEGQAPCTLSIEGDIVRKYQVLVNPDIDRSRVRFIKADACNLPKNIGQFGLIVLSLTLHHLPDPKGFLENVGDLIVPSGLLVIAETYTWHEMMDLPKERWVSGFTKENGEEVRGFEGLKSCLSSKFSLVEEDNMSGLMRMKDRMFRLAVPHVTVWIRKRT